MQVPNDGLPPGPNGTEVLGTGTTPSVELGIWYVVWRTLVFQPEFEFVPVQIRDVIVVVSLGLTWSSAVVEIKMTVVEVYSMLDPEVGTGVVHSDDVLLIEVEDAVSRAHWYISVTMKS